MLIHCAIHQGSGHPWDGLSPTPITHNGSISPRDYFDSKLVDTIKCEFCGCTHTIIHGVYVCIQSWSILTNLNFENALIPLNMEYTWVMRQRNFG